MKSEAAIRRVRKVIWVSGEVIWVLKNVFVWINRVFQSQVSVLALSSIITSIIRSFFFFVANKEYWFIVTSNQLCACAFVYSCVYLQRMWGPILRIFITILHWTFQLSCVFMLMLHFQCELSITVCDYDNKRFGDRLSDYFWVGPLAEGNWNKNMHHKYALLHIIHWKSITLYFWCIYLSVALISCATLNKWSTDKSEN